MAAAMKPLHLATNLEELNKKIIKSDKLKQTTPKVLCRLADKVLLKAKDELLAGDQEQAYILYMRFIDMYKVIYASKEYKRDKGEFNKLLPTSKVSKALDNAESLSKALESRYSELTFDPSEAGGSTSKDDQVVPASPKRESHTSLQCVTPTELYQLLTQQPNDVVVLDCRPRAEFLGSHPDTKKRFPQWLGLPEETIKKGVTDAAVLTFLSTAGKEKWRDLAAVGNIVLVDDHSTMEALSNPPQGEAGSLLQHPILGLRDALFKLNTTPPLTSDPRVLEGGYAMWHLTYGVTCVGAYRRKASGCLKRGSVASTSHSGSSSTLEYPTFPEVREIREVTGDESSPDEEEEEEGMEVEGTTYQTTPISQQPTLTSHQATPTPSQQQPLMNTQGYAGTGLVPPLVGVAGPLPLPPSSIPVALSLEGETTPMLSTEHDLLSDYPQLLMREEYEEEVPADGRPFTQPGGAQDTAHYMQQQQPQQGLPQQAPPHVMSQQVPSHGYEGQQPYPPQGYPPQGYPPQGNREHFHQVPTSDSVSSVQYQPQQRGGVGHHQGHQVPPRHQYAQQQQPPQQAFSGAQQNQLPPQQQGYSGAQQNQQPPQQQGYSGAQQNQQPPQQQGYSGVQQNQQPPQQQGYSGAQQNQQPPQQQGYSGVQQNQQPPQQQGYSGAQQNQQSPQQQGYSGAQQNQQPHQQQGYSGAQQNPQPPQQQSYSGAQQNQQPTQQQGYSAAQQPPQQGYSGAQQNQQPPQQQGYSAAQQPPQQQGYSGVQQNQQPPQQQTGSQNLPATTQTPPPNMQAETGSAHQFNPRVAIGPIPQPPTYDQALSLPSLPPTSQPLPPPISISPGQLSGGSSHVTRTVGSAESAGSRPPEVAPRPPPQQAPSQTPQVTANMGAGPPRPPPQQAPSQAPHTGAGQEEVKKLREETRKVQELHSQMQSEMNRLTEARAEQEAAAKQLAEGQAMLQAQRLDHARTMEEEKRSLERMKKQYEKEVESMVTEKQRYLQMQEAEKRRGQERGGGVAQQQQQHKELAQRAGLPNNWEKRLDHTTGRYYYVDHSTQTTHWNPPTQLIDYQRQQDEARRAQEEATRRQQEEMRLRLAQQQQRNHAVPVPVTAPGTRVTAPGAPSGHVTAPSAPPGHVTTPSGQLTRVPSSTQVAPRQQPQATPTPQTSQSVPKPADETTPHSRPVVNRSVKPTPTVDRSKKPVPVLWTHAQIKEKEANLQPIFGVERHLLTGLRNLGNTCFMNSTLQCLGHTSPVMPYFTSYTFQKDINYSNPIGHKGAVAKEFSWLMRSLWSGRYKSVTPRDFKNMVDQYIPTMQGHAQQDAQEFLAFLMNGLHEDLNRVHTRTQIAEVDSGSLDEPAHARLTWGNHLKRNSSVIVDYFQGMYRSSVICNYCKKRSVTFEPFMYLSLPIPPGQQAYSIQDCLRLFSEQETVAWKCSGCNRSAGARKTIEIWKLPAILLIALSRFTHDGMWKEKRQNYIDYPVGKSLLNMSSYVVGERPKTGYRLYAVSNHFGTQSGGHYTACCLNPYNHKYYNFDDHEVTEAVGRQVKSGAGYLLFYTSLDHQPHRAKF